MISRWSILPIGVVAFGLVIGARSTMTAQETKEAKKEQAVPKPEEAAAPEEVPQLRALPSTNCCLSQLHKRAKGQRTIRFGAPYTCDTGSTSRGLTQYQFTLVSEGAPCDQGNVIPNGSLLRASGQTFRRADGLAVFSGEFQIVAPGGGTVLFTGTMEVMDRIGTHHAPFGAEACNQQSHLEGCLVGWGAAALPNHQLRALIVASDVNLPTGTQPAPIPLASIDGVLAKCP